MNSDTVDELSIYTEVLPIRTEPVVFQQDTLIFKIFWTTPCDGVYRFTVCQARGIFAELLILFSTTIGSVVEIPNGGD